MAADPPTEVLPLPRPEIKTAIVELIREKGLDVITSASIRAHLQERFGHDFTAHKKTIDEMTRKTIEEMMAKKVKQDKASDSEEAEAKPDHLAQGSSKVEPKGSMDSQSGEESSDSESGSESDDSDKDIKPKPQMRSGSESSESEVEKKPVKVVKKRREVSSPDPSVGTSRERKTKRRSKPLPVEKKQKNAGKSSFSKILFCSEALQAVTNKPYMRRCDVVKAVWNYIRTNQLTDPNEKTFILSDDKLEKIFGTKRFRGFGMMAGLKEHLFDPAVLGGEHVEKAEVARKELLDELDVAQEEEPVKKRSKKGKSSFSKLLYCSLHLQAVTEKQFMRRCDVVKSLWAYFSANDLKDPKNKRYIKSDDKLYKIFGRKRFEGFGMMSTLSEHLTDPKEMGQEYVKMAEEVQRELDGVEEAQQSDSE